MHPYSLAILVLLVTGHDTVTSVIPLVFLSPFLIVSALVIFTHAYASSVEFARHISGLYDRYETLNFYQPGYKSYSNRRHIALWQIAAEELIKKLERRLSRGVVQSGQEKTTPTSSTSLPLVPEFTTRLVAWLISFGSIAVYLSSATLQEAIAVFVRAAFYSFIAVFSMPILIYIALISALAVFLGTCRGLNVGVLHCIMFACQIIFSYVPCYLNARILAAFVCVTYVAIALAIPALRYLKTQLAVCWTTVAIWVFTAMVCAWAYPIRGRLYRCSKRAIESIGQSAWAWEELYDKDHDFPAEPEQKPKRTATWKAHVLCNERWPPVQQPARSNGTGVESGAQKSKACVAGSENPSRGVRRMEALTTLKARHLAAGFSLRTPQAASPLWKLYSTTRSGVQARQSALAAISAPPISIPQTTPSSSSSSHSSPSSSSSLLSPPTSNGSLPQLTPDTSAEIGIPASTAPSRSSTLRVHGPTTRARAKILPMQVPKWIAQARTATGEEKVTAELHKSEWRERVKLRRERKIAKDTTMEVDVSLVEGRAGSPMDIEAGDMESGRVVPAMPVVENRSGGMVEPTSAATSSSMDSSSSPPSQSIDVLEAAVAGEPVEVRQTRELHHSRRHTLAARSLGTDAPVATSRVASTSDGVSAGLIPLPSHSGSLVSTNHMDSSTTPTSTSLVPAVPPAPTPRVDVALANDHAQAPPMIATDHDVRPAPMDIPTTNPGPPSITSLDILASVAATATPAATTTSPNPIKPGRMTPVHTWLMDDGTKRVMKKGEVIPARAKYMLKNERGSKLMSVGAKPLKV